MIDWTVTVGNLLTILSVTGGGVWVFFAVRRDVDLLSQKLIPIESAVIKLTVVLETLARQDERIKSVERDLERNHSRQQRGQSGSG